VMRYTLFGYALIVFATITIVILALTMDLGLLSHNGLLATVSLMLGLGFGLASFTVMNFFEGGMELFFVGLAFVILGFLLI